MARFSLFAILAKGECTSNQIHRSPPEGDFSHVRLRIYLNGERITEGRPHRFSIQKTTRGDKQLHDLADDVCSPHIRPDPFPDRRPPARTKARVVSGKDRLNSLSGVDDSLGQGELAGLRRPVQVGDGGHEPFKPFVMRSKRTSEECLLGGAAVKAVGEERLPGGFVAEDVENARFGGDRIRS